MRTLTAAYSSAIASGHIRLLVLIDMYFDFGTSRFALAPYNIVYAGNTYLGAARIAAVEAIKELGDVEATGLAFQLLANAAYIAIAQDEPIQGRRVTMRLALLDANYQIMADPVICFEGRLDQMNISVGKNAIIKVTAESRFAAWDVARVRRYNSPDQQFYYPDDTFFDFVPQMVSKTLEWGVPNAARSSVVTANSDNDGAGFGMSDDSSGGGGGGGD